jgi:transcriptional regulator with XRE-family HTH domain
MSVHQVIPSFPFHVRVNMKGFSMSGVKIAGSGALCMAALCRYLKAAFPASTAKQVAHATGIPASSVEKWLRGETRPSAEHFCILCATFGAGFAALAMPGALWLQEAGRDAEFRASAERLFGLLARH